MDDDERVFHPVSETQHTAAPLHSPATRGSDHDDDGVSRSIRTHPPADYIHKFQNFSLFYDASIQLHLEKLHTGVFEAGGYKWRLHLYPRGDLKRDASGYISIYLVVADRILLPVGWEINVNFRLFLYNQKEDHYLTLQDAVGRVTRFNQMRTESGFAKFISLGELMDQPSSGYLMDDSLVFGAEVFVIGNKRQLESLSATHCPNAGAVSWKLSDFSKQRCPSHVFSAWTRNWKLEATVKEVGLKINLTLMSDGPGTYLSGLRDFMIKRWFDQKEDQVELVPQIGDVYAEWGARVRNQINEAQNITIEGQSWFRADSRKWGSWSCTNVISLSDLTDESKGYVVDDTLIIDLVFDVIREVKNTTLLWNTYYIDY